VWKNLWASVAPWETRREVVQYNGEAGVKADARIDDKPRR